MPSVRHHLQISQALMVQAQAHLESAFEHSIDHHYDPKWTAAIDNTITATAKTIIQVHSIKTCLEPPATAPNSKEQPGE